ncbi:MAG TPA: hypothetical protein VMV57_03975 [Terracidiphilus sp.]|nr:hypothetical protein [Terracidiphilus sp.]
MTTFSIFPKFLKTVRNLALVTFLMPFASLLAAQTTDSPEINELLKQIKTHAALADRDGEKLLSYTNSKIPWQAHASRLTQIKVHANNLIEDFNQMSALRDQGSEWQQDVIDQIGPRLQTMSSHLSATIEHLNGNQNRLALPEYRDYVRTNSEFLHNTYRMISDYLDYGEAKSKADMLEKRLALTQPETSGA